MAFLALVILGCVTFGTLPVSLLPDVAIPHIAVQVAEDNVSARELETTIVAPLRRQLMQTSGLAELKSETRDGTAVVALTMEYGVDTDLAFIEVNEKIDAAMNSLPKTANRPKAVKASATDIPVVYLQLTLKDENGTLNSPPSGGRGPSQSSLTWRKTSSAGVLSSCPKSLWSTSRVCRGSRS